MRVTSVLADSSACVESRIPRAARPRARSSRRLARGMRAAGLSEAAVEQVARQVAICPLRSQEFCNLICVNGPAAFAIDGDWGRAGHTPLRRLSQEHVLAKRMHSRAVALDSVIPAPDR